MHFPCTGFESRAKQSLYKKTVIAKNKTVIMSVVKNLHDTFTKWRVPFWLTCQDNKKMVKETFAMLLQKEGGATNECII